MGRIISISMVVLTLVVLSGYTGWYFGHIEGFDKAKKQYDTTYSSNKRSLKNSPTQINKKQYQPHSSSITKAKRQVAKMEQLINDTAKLNQLNTKKSYSVAKVNEKTPSCRWVVGRMDELQRIINSGGKGTDSRFCDEYNRRKNELYSNKCSSQAVFRLSNL